MIVMFPPEVEQQINALAAQMKIDPASLVASVVERNLNASALTAANGSAFDDDYDPDALKKATERITKRTPEEREAVRQELLKTIPAPLPIPEGKTVFDMLSRIRGEETEEQVYEALKHLS